jgi:hypothetical protein
MLLTLAIYLAARVCCRVTLGGHGTGRVVHVLHCLILLLIARRLVSFAVQHDVQFFYLCA